FIPTRPGNYTFHLVGSIRGQSFDRSLSPADKHGLEPVKDPDEVQFPAKDPSLGELASRLDRLAPRLETFESATRTESEATSDRAGLATKLGIAGIIIGTLALALGVTGALRARSRVAGASRAAPSRKEQTHA
ncbi:MAG: hypothetical protein ACRDJG_08085, partial [Actinomycetota bacterium]